MKFIEKLDNNKVIICLLTFTIVGITLIFSQYFGLFPLADEYALDMLNYYSKSQFFSTIALLDQSSRTSYLMIHLADYLFMIGFYQLIGIGLYRIIKNNELYKWFIILPYLAFLFDFLENIIMDIHLLIFPNKIEFLGYIVGIFTLLKFVFLYITITIILICIIYKIFIKVRDNRINV